MPTYSWKCPNCGNYATLVRRIVQRDDPVECSKCTLEMTRLLAAPLFKISGRVTPGGGPDKFTADMLRIPLKDLPSGLRTEKERK